MRYKPSMDGIVAGYDPGGNGCHGVALLTVSKGLPVKITADLVSNAEDAIEFFEQHGPIFAIGVDTLTCWSTGAGGWRPADRWLRQNYPGARNSVVTPNGLFGSMGLNGMAVLIAMRAADPSLWISETHPKVLHWHLTKTRYDYESNANEMHALLQSSWSVSASATCEHEWDAAISALAAYEGLAGNWRHDLHQLPTSEGERIVCPCGPTHYVWPGATAEPQ
jgi:hypothetical protein